MSKNYKLIPTRTYTKDPIIHVDAASENCYVFVRVENGVSVIADQIATQMTTNHWESVDGETNVYYYEVDSNSIVAGGANLPVFNSFSIPATATYAEISGAAGQSVVVTAYAVQAEGFASAQAAWDATYGA